MISAAAHSLQGIVDTTKPGAATLPPVEKLTQFSRTVAKAVAECAIKEGLAPERCMLMLRLMPSCGNQNYKNNQ